MNFSRTNLLKSNMQWHKWLGWTGGLALLMFAFSGIMHPVMTWTGPKAAAFFPPQVAIKAQYVKSIAPILSGANIEQAVMVKLVPTNKQIFNSGALLQVTRKNENTRHYFNLDSGSEVKDYDLSQAKWLASYYSGLDETRIKSVALQSEFDSAYPWVNRLLPVYKVTFDTDDNLELFIYTELSALAGISNDWKKKIQSIFRFLHTWSWLEKFESARVFLMMILLLSLFGMTLTGTAMVFLLKNRNMEKKRRFHRLMSYLIWLPLFLFSISGTYHLLQYQYGDDKRGLKLGENISLDKTRFGDNVNDLAQFEGVKLNSVSLVESGSGSLLYRLSIPKGKEGQHVKKSQRFDGMAVEKNAWYFDAKTGAKSDLGDKEIAINYANKYSGLSSENISKVSLVTHFGPAYDFRNKRLPVWRIDYDTDSGDQFFVDPATGMLVDHAIDATRYEGLSFTFLHKWNFLRPLGRMVRDGIMVSILSLAIIATLLGYILLIKRRQKKYT